MVRHCSRCPEMWWCPIPADKGQGTGLWALMGLWVSLCAAGSVNRRPLGVSSPSNDFMFLLYDWHYSPVSRWDPPRKDEFELHTHSVHLSMLKLTVHV